MRGNLFLRGWSLVVVLAAAPLVSVASPNDKNSKLELGPNSWNVDAMISQASKNVNQRYNCNEEQSARTQEMMSAGVHRFLRENQDEIWPLLRDLWEYQLKGELPDAEKAARIGARVRPLLLAAQQAILEGNEVWGQYLSEDQRQLHEFDLEEMRKTMQKMDSNFEGWEAGNPVLQPIFPKYQKKADEPKRPTKPPVGPMISNESFKTHVPDTQDAWLRGYRNYVERFVKDYILDETQIEAATSILREIEARAEAHLASVKGAQNKINQRKAEAMGNAEWDAYRKQLKAGQVLNAPLSDLFDELKTRLETIPTEAQRQSFRDRLKSGAISEEAKSTKTGSSKSLSKSLSKSRPTGTKSPDSKSRK